MRIERLRSNPDVLLVSDFVSSAEARALTVEADGRFDRSTTVCDDNGGRCAHPSRTSSSAMLPSSPLTRVVQERGMRLLVAPTVAEDLQVVRYYPGEEFKPHLDAFDESPGGVRAKAQYGGAQRDTTVLVYLQAPDEGGETVFPALGLTVAPIPLAAVVWRNIHPDGRVDGRLLHGGAPVRRGVKYAANLWLRARPGGFRWP